MMKYLYCIGGVVVYFVLLLTGCQLGDMNKEIETEDQLSEYDIKNNRPDSAVLVKLKTIVVQDKAQAASWYRKAAEQGDAEARKALGLMVGILYPVP